MVLVLECFSVLLMSFCVMWYNCEVVLMGSLVFLGILMVIISFVFLCVFLVRFLRLLESLNFLSVEGCNLWLILCVCLMILLMFLLSFVMVDICLVLYILICDLMIESNCLMLLCRFLEICMCFKLICLMSWLVNCCLCLCFICMVWR